MKKKNKTKLNIVLSTILVIIIVALTVLIYIVNDKHNRFEKEFKTDSYIFSVYEVENNYGRTYYKKSDKEYGFIEDYDGQKQIIDCSVPDEYTLCGVYKEYDEKEFMKIYNIVTKLDYVEDGIEFKASSSDENIGEFDVVVSKGGKYLKLKSDSYVYEIDLTKGIEIPKETK